MALKPTIYKFKAAVSDMNRDYYDALNLTFAQHPSETTERMMVQILAYCLNAPLEGLTFTKGLNDNDEPALWAKSLDDQLMLWIDVGEPAFDRIKKATRIAQQTKLYSFNAKSDVWWAQNASSFKTLALDVVRFDWGNIQSLAKMVERTMDFSVSISGESAYFSTAKGDCEVHWEVLQTG